MSAKVRTSAELALMRKSGLITAKALKKTLSAVQPGVDLLTLDKIAEEEIGKLGGRPSFKTVAGYHWTSCLTVNQEVVHGIPRPIELKEGDVLGIDLGTVYQGWHTDAAWSVTVGGSLAGEKPVFLKVGEEALWKAIDQAHTGNRIGDISAAIQTTIEGQGYSVVRSLVGHGVGRALHEEPEVPGVGKGGSGPVLKENMTIAIEAIYTSGRPEVVLEDDKWTVSTSDGSLGGLFEMTVIIGEHLAEVLTDWRAV